MSKSGIDFFPLDVSLDSKFELIEAEFGLTGFGVVVHLLQEIYGKAGYYIEWTEEVALLFARKIGAGGGVVSEIIEASIKRGMFDKEIYDKYRVLTSRGIQKRYFEAVSRRKVLEVDYNILLVDVAKICINVDIQAKNVNIFSKNADIQKQSKVEKSKVEKSKVKNDIGAEPVSGSTPPIASIVLNDKTFFDVTQDDYDRWCELYPDVNVMQELRKMVGWCESNPKKRKTRSGIRNFINTWLSKEQDKGGKNGVRQKQPQTIRHEDAPTDFERDAIRRMMEKTFDDDVPDF